MNEPDLAEPDTWTSLHAFHHTEQDRLIVEAAAPEFARQHEAGLVRSWFYLRYWDGGPHVRFRLRARNSTVAGARDGLSAALLRHMNAHPAPTVVDPDSYRISAAALAGYEAVADYERELRPPGTVAEISYRPETGVYGTGAAIRAAERHFGFSSELAVEILRSDLPQAKRRGLVLSLTVLTIAVVEPDLERIAASVAPAVRDRGGLAQPADPALVERLDLQVHGLWELASGSEYDDTVFHRWRDEVRRLRTELEESREQGDFEVARSGSPLTRLVPGFSPIDAVLTRCTHLFANRVGLSVAEESQVNILMAHALLGAGSTRTSARR